MRFPPARRDIWSVDVVSVSNAITGAEAQQRGLSSDNFSGVSTTTAPWLMLSITWIGGALAGSAGSAASNRLSCLSLLRLASLLAVFLRQAVRRAINERNS